MSDKSDPMHEAHLECGDTVSTSSLPRIGALRYCIHCESHKRVTAVVDHRPQLASAEALPSGALLMAQAQASGYSAAYGYAAQQLDFIVGHLTATLLRAGGMTRSELLTRIDEARDMAVRGVQEASSALARYGA